MENKKPKTLQEVKNIFENLKTDAKSLLLSEENLNMRHLKKHKKWLFYQQVVAKTYWLN